MIEVIILAGGFGTRLRKVVSDVPKPMAPVKEKPFLAYQMEMLKKRGVNRVILSVGFKSEIIIEYFGDSYSGLKIEYVVEEYPLGTGGAIKLAIERCTQDHVYVLNGDTYLDYPIKELEELWQSDKKPIITGVEVKEALRYGKLNISGDSREIVGLSEKGACGPGIINAGCYVIPTNFFARYDKKKFSFENDFLKNYLSNKKINLLLTDKYFIDIGIPSDYGRFINYISEIN